MPLKFFAAFSMSLAMAMLSLPAPAWAADDAVRQVTVPLRFEQHRPYADMTLSGPDGHVVRALAYLDTGGGAIILAPGLARRLGLQPTGKAIEAQGSRLTPTNVPGLRLGHMRLHLQGATAFIASSFRGTDAQIAFPVRVLRRYEVVFDYPHGLLTVAAPDVLKHRGKPVAAHFGSTGFIGVTAHVDGKGYGFVLDTGGQYCMITRAVLSQWRHRHPHWAHVKGAFGPADMMLGKGEAKFEMQRIGHMRWGPFTLDDVGSVSRPKGSYESMMSNLVGAPVIGSLGGNVFKDFRIDIDYPHSKLYVGQVSRRRPEVLDMVGVTLERQDGHVVVDGLMPGQGGLKPGDRLLRIGSLDADTATNAQLIQALSGRPGATRQLLVERDGKRITVQATVRHVF